MTGMFPLLFESIMNMNLPQLGLGEYLHKLLSE